jgi:hypothetical protein
MLLILLLLLLFLLFQEKVAQLYAKKPFTQHCLFFKKLIRFQTKATKFYSNGSRRVLMLYEYIFVFLFKFVV